MVKENKKESRPTDDQPKTKKKKVSKKEEKEIKELPKEGKIEVFPKEEKPKQKKSEKNNQEEKVQPEDEKKEIKTRAFQKPHIKKRGKKYKEVSKLIDREKFYTPEEAIESVLKTAVTKFDSSVEAHIRLSIKPEQSEQNIRTVVDLPEGTGRKVKVAAIISSGKEKEVNEAGANIIGSDDLISKIEKGFLGFDVVVATPDMMGKIGKLGKILGTKGLMPNPKIETVTDNPGRVIKLIKKGRVELKNDKFGIVHSSFGKVSYGKEKLLSNFLTFTETLLKAKPAQVKGQLVKSVAISTTMGPSVKIDINKL